MRRNVIKSQIFFDLPYAFFIVVRECDVRIWDEFKQCDADAPGTGEEIEATNWLLSVCWYQRDRPFKPKFGFIPGDKRPIGEGYGKTQEILFPHYIIEGDPEKES